MSTINLSDETTMQAECRRLVDREVFLCVSNVVHCIASGYGNIVGEDAKPLREAAEQAGMLSMPVADYESAAREYDGRRLIACPGGFQVVSDIYEPASRGSVGSGWINLQIHKTEAIAWQAACEADDIEPHEREVFEHWAVSDWLADKLEEQGETVDRDFAGLTVWARTTTGQAIMLDCVIRDIVRALHAA